MCALPFAPAAASDYRCGFDWTEHGFHCGLFTGACSDSPDAAFAALALVDLHLWQMSIVLSLQAAAIAGLLISLMTWVLVAVATPAPIYIAEVALAQARVLQDRIPEELRERLMRNVA
jgi:hypothetical protein